MSINPPSKKVLEIERKWLLPSLPLEIAHSNFQEVPCVKLEQGYLVSEPEVELRVRREGPKHFITRKIGNGLVREEKQKPIKAETFTDLTAGLMVGRMVEKWRFIYKMDGHLLEFDLFEGYLQGLVLLEVEFKSVEAARAFSLPSWITGAEEVTGNSKYSNKNLAMSDLP